MIVHNNAVCRSALTKYGVLTFRLMEAHLWGKGGGTYTAYTEDGRPICTVKGSSDECLKKAVAVLRGWGN